MVPDGAYCTSDSQCASTYSADHNSSALLLPGACANNVCLASSGSACPSVDSAGDAACAGGASGATKCVAYSGGNMCTLAVVTWAVAPVQPYDLT